MNAARESRRDQPSGATSDFQPGLLRGFLLGAIFADVLLACGEFMRRRLPFPPVPAVQPKVEWQRAHGDEYDTFFVGSSRTLRRDHPRDLVDHEL